MRQNKETCLEIMDYLIATGFTHQLHIKEVEKAIVHIRGTDKRTINNWLRALLYEGYLRRVSSCIYEVDTRHPEILVKAIGEPKQKKLM